MSGDSIVNYSSVLTPLITVLQGSITAGDIVDIFSSMVTVALPIGLIWFGCHWCYSKFRKAVTGGRG